MKHHSALVFNRQKGLRKGNLSIFFTRLNLFGVVKFDLGPFWNIKSQGKT